MNQNAAPRSINPLVRRNIAVGLLLTAFSLAHSDTQAGWLDRVVKIERNGDSVGINVNPLGVFSKDKKQDQQNDTPSGGPTPPEVTITAPDQSQSADFTQARLAEGAIHLAFIDTPERRTTKNTGELSKLPLFTQLTGGKTYFNSTEVKHFILVDHGFLPPSETADPIRYLISESSTERIRSMSMNQFEKHDEAPRLREKFKRGLEEARGIDRGIVFAWTAWPGDYDFNRKGCHFGGQGWPGGIFINGTEVYSLFFPVEESEARASVARRTDYYIIQFEGRIMDKDEIAGQSLRLSIPVPLALSKATLYLVRRREDGKIVPELYGKLTFNDQKVIPQSTSSNYLPVPAVNSPKSVATRDVVSKQISTPTPLAAPQIEQQTLQIPDGQTPREFVESSAWAEFSQTWRQSGDTWVATKTVMPETYNVKLDARQWPVSSVASPDSGCELKNLTCEIQERPVSELERLNGLSERWIVKFRAGYFRTKSATGWSAWKSSSSNVLHLRYESKNGDKLTMLTRTPVWSPR